MQAEHVSGLACPQCRGDLEAREASVWIESETSSCADCSATFPVESGVPRSVDASSAEPATTGVDSLTQAAFGFQWLHCPVTTLEEDRMTVFGLTGIEPALCEKAESSDLPGESPRSEQRGTATTSRLQGMRMIEGGCGMGKHVWVTSDLGAELAVGLDASDAVERAAQVIEWRPNVFIVQGDIFQPPPWGGFDFDCSVGVPCYIPAPQQSFESIASDDELAEWFLSVGIDTPRRLPDPVSAIARAGGGWQPVGAAFED